MTMLFPLGTAKLSPDGVYRYELTRVLPDKGDRVLVACGLNPSTADAQKNDNTIRKDLGFAKIWGCARLVKINAYAFRATFPKDLKKARLAGIDVVGPDNNRAILAALELVRKTNGILMVAWGANIEQARQIELARMFGDTAMCLGTNLDGSPEHELYIPYERPLVHWSCP